MSQLSVEDLDKIVLAYLRRKRYAEAEAAFSRESNVASLQDLVSNVPVSHDDTTIANFLLMSNVAESNPQRYEQCYTPLRDWMQSSLEQYKGELLNILYPIFVHCYLDLVAKGHADAAQAFMEKHGKDHAELHAVELQRLRAVVDPLHMRENELVQNFRNNKYNLTLCSYSFELLMAFLQEHKFLLLLSIINQYVNIQILEGQPQYSSGRSDPGVLTGGTQHQVREMNTVDLQWTVPKEEARNKDETGAKKKMEEIRIRPNIAFPPDIVEHVYDHATEELTYRVEVGPAALPSCAFLTFLNAKNLLNTVELSPDGAALVGGFSDSSVRLWDIEATSPEQPAFGQGGQLKQDEPNVFVGHSGPVYGVSLSPDSQFVLSSSEDKTVRLWSMETESNLVCYKGHNYPVWDVTWSPFGFYFASAGHDRTARLWSVDHITPLRIYAGHLSDVDCVKFHPNCNYLATGSSDKCIRLWDVQTGGCVRIFTGHLGAVISLAFSPDGRMLASGGDDNLVIVWDIASGRRLAEYRGHTASVWDMAFSRESALLASGGGDNTIRLWDTHGGAQGVAEDARTVYRTKNTPVLALEFTRRNLLLACGAFSR